MVSSQAYVTHEKSPVNDDNYTFDVAKYPLSPFVFPSYSHTTFDPARKIFVDAMAIDGRAVGSETQNSVVDGQKVYVMGIGDAGYVASASAFVKGNDLFVIQMSSAVNPSLVNGAALTFQQKVESLQGYFGIYTSMPQNMKLQIKK